MRRLKLLATTLVFASLVGSGLSVFNCTRTGTPCLNAGVCDTFGGTCTCIGTTSTGYDCSQDHRYIMNGACMSSNPCTNGGTCFDMASAGTTGVSQCYCPYDFYGEHCELPTVQNECYQDQMVINVYRGEAFAGVVGIEQKSGMCHIQTVSSQVEFTLDQHRNKWRGYAAVLPFVGAACGAVPNVTYIGSEITYTYDVLVRYNSRTAGSDADELISFSCTVPNPGGPFAGPTAVLYSIADAAGGVVVNPKVGSPITITFKVDPSSMFSDLAVQSCTVYNMYKTMSKPVVVNSCPTKPFGESLVKQGDKHILTLVVHMFGNDPNLNFECSVKVCTSADMSCQQLPTCPTSAPAGPAAGGQVPSTADLWSLIMPGSSSGATDPLSTLQSLLGGSSPMTGGTSSPSATNLLGTNILNDLFPPTAGGTTGGAAPPARKRRDVSADVMHGDNVVIVRGVL